MTPRASMRLDHGRGEHRRLEGDRLHQALAAHLGYALTAAELLEAGAQPPPGRCRRARAAARA